MSETRPLPACPPASATSATHPPMFPLPRPQISEPPLVLLPVLFFPTSSWVLTGPPGKVISRGLCSFWSPLPSAARCVECLFCARPHAKHFLHILAVTPHSSPMREVTISPILQAGKYTHVAVFPDCCASLHCTPRGTLDLLISGPSFPTSSVPSSSLYHPNSTRFPGPASASTVGSDLPLS